jgi:hypothetical protein
MKFNRVLLIVSLIFSGLVFGSEANKSVEPKTEVVKSSQFGPHMAVVDFNKEDGFKMSEKALGKLKVKFAKILGSNSWTIPEESLVRIKQSLGVYRRLDGWITYILVKVSQKSSGVVTITSPDLENGDEVAITGVNFLRMTDADLNSDTVDSCAH